MSYTRWDVKGRDVPGGRCTKSVGTGLSHFPERDRTRIVAERKNALDRLRAAAKAAKTEEDRNAMWSAVPEIGSDAGPHWDQLVAARTPNDFLALAMTAGTVGGDTATATPALLRTVQESIEEYVAHKKHEDYSPETVRQTESQLTRALAHTDPETGRAFGQSRIAGLTHATADAVLREQAKSEDSRVEGNVVARSTRRNQRKHLKAWLNWELRREETRALDESRQPLYTVNVFERRGSKNSAPNRSRHETAAERQHGRRFFPEEADALINTADVRTATAFLTCRVLGLRPAELVHLRWGVDVRVLEEGHGYRIDVQGGRRRDERCRCPQCQDEKGWAPKNGPRTYILDRNLDEIGWITPLCDALEKWVAMRQPEFGAFLFPSPEDPGRAWTNKNLNERLHRTADEVRRSGAAPGLQTGQKSPRRLTWHSWRHTCASEMLEAGVPHAYAAEWIGDSLKTFKKTYGKPRPEDVARATLADYRRTPTGLAAELKG